MNRSLTNYMVSTDEAVFRRWQDLAQTMLTRNVDGYTKDEKDHPKAAGCSARSGFATSSNRAPTSSSCPRPRRPPRPTIEPWRRLASAALIRSDHEPAHRSHGTTAYAGRVWRARE